MMDLHIYLLWNPRMSHFCTDVNLQNKVNQKVLLRMLNSIGVENVCVVGNGQEAVEADENETFDIILMDMQMPVMDGLDATRRITARRDKRTDRAPSIIFVTAHVSPSFQTACNNAGGSGFLTKPFHIRGLEDILRKAYLAREIESSDEDASETTTNP
mmetsp:Transcript_17899/g.33779  ORF Transcript_17899/g.33779 Transcript_17899/m.33779 type:complete len:158 (+) Transcript_17899:746-1219(+)